MNRFFILGCQRTGTTLLRLALDSHSQIDCLDEKTAYPVFEKRVEYRSAKPIVGLKMPVITELFVEYDCIKSEYHGEPILFCQRDLLQVLASAVGLGRKWMKTEMCDKVDAWMNDPSRKFQKAYADRYMAAVDSEHPDFCKAALYWDYKSKSCDDMEFMGYKVRRVEYANLVQQPRQELEAIVDFLGVSWEDSLLQHHQLEHSDVCNGITIGNTVASRRIDTDSLDLWRTALSESEIAALENFAKLL